MKIRKLIGDVVTHVTAITITNRKKEMFFNIKHGSHGDNLWMYSMGLDKRYFIPTNQQDTIVLSDNNYNIAPIKKDKKILKDIYGNTLYYLTTDLNTTHKNDILLFWEIPNHNYKKVSYNISGNVICIGEGISGKCRSEIIYTSPAPVLEITGDCILTTTIETLTGEILTKQIEYKNDEFTVIQDGK